MAEAASKLQVKQEGKSVPATPRTASLWQPFESLRQEMDRVFEDFTRGFGRFPLSRSVFDPSRCCATKLVGRRRQPAVVEEGKSSDQPAAGLDEGYPDPTADEIPGIRGERGGEARNYLG